MQICYTLNDVPNAELTEVDSLLAAFKSIVYFDMAYLDDGTFLITNPSVHNDGIILDKAQLSHLAVDLVREATNPIIESNN